MKRSFLYLLFIARLTIFTINTTASTVSTSTDILRHERCNTVGLSSSK